MVSKTIVRTKTIEKCVFHKHCGGTASFSTVGEVKCRGTTVHGIGNVKIYLCEHCVHIIAHEKISDANLKWIVFEDKGE